MSRELGLRRVVTGVRPWGAEMRSRCKSRGSTGDRVYAPHAFRDVVLCGLCKRSMGHLGELKLLVASLGYLFHDLAEPGDVVLPLVLRLDRAPLDRD
jgi:hypothetical protein